MVIANSPKQVTEVPRETDPSEEDVAHWFFYTPCAGVTYYSFEPRPARPASVKPQAPEDTKSGAV